MMIKPRAALVLIALDNASSDEELKPATDRR
jgi:hypothetical protein